MVSIPAGALVYWKPESGSCRRGEPCDGDTGTILAEEKDGRVLVRTAGHGDRICLVSEIEVIERKGG